MDSNLQQSEVRTIDEEDLIDLYEAHSQWAKVTNQGHLSLDLTEATYNIPFDILDANCDLMDDVLEGFAPWEVFSDFFRIHQREVDMEDLIEQGLWEGPRVVNSARGSFMGDTLSFIHLSLYLRASTYVACGPKYKPIGQSVGDDLVLLGVTAATADRFRDFVKKTGGKTSKYDAFSKDSMTFCEAFAVRPNDSRNYPKYADKSRFGDLFFLDIIKGSLFSGKPKVKANGATPFIGHAKMLNKQLDYHPIEWVHQRAKTLFWARNYWHVKKLSTAMISLPEHMGGLNAAIGSTVKYTDQKFQQYYLPYYEAIAQHKLDSVVIAFTSLLRGIFAANPKGVKWQNDLDKINEVVGGLQLIRVRNLRELVPDWMSRKSEVEQLRYVGRELNLGSIVELTTELARRDAFHEIWQDRQVRKDFMTLPVTDARKRHKQAWDEIRKNLVAKDPKDWVSKDMSSLSAAIKDRLWNVFFDKNDVSIKEAFKGTPDLYLSFGEKTKIIRIRER